MNFKFPVFFANHSCSPAGWRFPKVITRRSVILSPGFPVVPRGSPWSSSTSRDLPWFRAIYPDLLNHSWLPLFRFPWHSCAFAARPRGCWLVGSWRCRDRERELRWPRCRNPALRCRAFVRWCITSSHVAALQASSAIALKCSPASCFKGCLKIMIVEG